MGWAVEQNTGVAGRVIRLVWFKGYIYAFTEDHGVYRRDGVGPWVQVFTGSGLGWYWEDDDALYCPGPPVGLTGAEIWRSEDGVTWVQDIDLFAVFGAHAGGWWHSWGAMGGYGDYFYYENHDIGGPGRTYFYRRDLDGNWDMPFAIHVGTEGANGCGIIGFGGEVYWTNNSHCRYWDGAAWSIETTLESQCGSLAYMSLIDDVLYVRTSTIYSYIGGYFWRTAAATSWSFLNLPVPDNTWGGWPLCEGADGETYTIGQNGLDIRIYRQIDNYLSLVSADTPAAGVGSRGGVCVDATGDMYFGTRALGTVRFFAFAGVYNVTPVGGGLYPQAMDCDGDGDMLYIALYDTATAQPILVSVALPLDGATSTGNNVFTPGAGTALNVQCIDVGDNLAISGSFAGAPGNEQVETSDDGGLTWTDIDRDAWGVETAQPLEVSPTTLDEVMVCLATVQDITETFDAGATAWIVNNPAIGYSPGAMALLANGDEMIIGDDAANRIDYSPNRGVSTANVTGAFGGNVAALEIT